MKKLLATVPAGTMVLGLAACNSKPAETEESVTEAYIAEATTESTAEVVTTGYFFYIEFNNAENGQVMNMRCQA